MEIVEGLQVILMCRLITQVNDTQAQAEADLPGLASLTEHNVHPRCSVQQDFLLLRA